MSTFNQPCPSCGRMLALPNAALGKQAKCPACATQFAANGPPENHPHNPDYTATGPIDPLANPPTPNPTTMPVGTSNPHTQSTGPVPQSPVASATNPYAPLDGVEPEKVGPVQIRSVGFEEVWADAWEITKANFGVLIGITAIMMGVSIGMSIIQQILGAIAGAIDPNLGMVAMLVLMPISFFVNAYVTVGMAGGCLAVARNEASPLQRLFAPIGGVGKYIGMMAAVFGGLLVVGGLIGGILVVILSLVGAGAPEIGIILGVVIFFVFAMLIGFVMWPIAYLCADNRIGFRESFSLCLSITSNNVLTVFLLVVIGAALGIFGVLMCYVGIILTMPLATMLFTIAYLRITGQPYAVPWQNVPPPAV